MRGQIEKRGDDTWRLRWYVGRDANGKRQYGSRTVRGTKRDAQRELRRLLGEVEHGVQVHAQRMTLDAYLDRWLEEAAPKKRRVGTVAHYRGILRSYVRPHLGACRLDQLTVLDVQRMVAKLEEQAKAQTKQEKADGAEVARLSPKTITYARAVLSAALAQAVRWRLLSANPCRDVEMPAISTERKMRALTPEECERLRAAVVGDRLEALFTVLLGTGLRPGEALALRWADVDLDAAELRVERSLPRQRLTDSPRFELPKTGTSRRRVALPPSVVVALRAHRARQAADRLKAGSLWADLDLVFTTLRGNVLRNDDVGRGHFKPALARAGLPRTVRLYDLRHTAATLMLSAGGSARAVADRLGHASAKMTLDVYAHSLPKQSEELTARLEAALFTPTHAPA